MIKHKMDKYPAPQIGERTCYFISGRENGPPFCWNVVLLEKSPIFGQGIFAFNFGSFFKRGDVHLNITMGKTKK